MMSEPGKVGVYLIGACGAVSTTCVVGASAVGQGIVPPTGMLTMMADFDPLGLVDCAELVFGGCEIRRTTPLEAARELTGKGGFLDEAHVEAAESTLADLGERLDPGVLLTDSAQLARLEPNPRELVVDTPRRAVELVQQQLDAFRREAELDRVIVVNLASTEGHREPSPAYESLAAFERALDGPVDPRLHPSVLYAYAAIDAGCPYLNFTPSPGSAVPALIELAEARGVPHMGRDGKTGETLLKTTLAPMFVARAFKVLAWEGHNILGNRDGEVLDDPRANQTKRASKGESLAAILGDSDVHSRVRIDYVPSLADWKTAWDFIHFEGFLGTRMMLQLIWQGCDSALAAPLVLDMVRLLDHADRRNQGGLQPHLACFFKSPTGVDVHAFDEQVRLLMNHVARETAAASGVPTR